MNVHVAADHIEAISIEGRKVDPSVRERWSAPSDDAAVADDEPVHSMEERGPVWRIFEEQVFDEDVALARRMRLECTRLSTFPL